MSERLYYDDCYLREFGAVVVHAGADRRRVVLDRTAFYPTSGGQPFDTGFLNNAVVVEVIDDEAGIVHVLDRPMDGDRAHGCVDWPRRFDHMQQHTGQHLLSAVFEELFGMKTVSFHLGKEESTIELATGLVTPEQVRAAELRAADIVFENRPVHVTYEHSAEAEGLRKASERDGILRIVSIDGLDRSACGGTHVRATGEIGLILIRKLEKIRGNVRLEFLCGRRALERTRRDYDNLVQIAEVLSAGADETPALVRAQATRVAEAEKARRKLSMELAQARGRQLYGETAPAAAGLRRYRKRMAKGPVDEETRVESQSYCASGKGVYLATTDEPASVLLAVSADSGFHAGDLLKEFFRSNGGRGGGTAQLAQGSVPARESLAALARLLGFD